MPKTKQPRCARCGDKNPTEWLCIDCHDEIESISTHEVNRLYFALEKVLEMTNDEKIKEFVERAMRLHSLYVQDIEKEIG